MCSSVCGEGGVAKEMKTPCTLFRLLLRWLGTRLPCHPRVGTIGKVRSVNCKLFPRALVRVYAWVERGQPL